METLKTIQKHFGSTPNPKPNSTVSSLHVNPKDTASNLIDNSKEKANILNKYFASVFTKEPDGDFISLEDKQTP